MRITLFSVGTQGDVRPFVALGCGLMADGHEVRLATGRDSETMVKAHGLDYSPLNADFLEIMRRDPKALQKGLNPIAFVRTARRELSRMADGWSKDGYRAALGADLLIGGGMVAGLAASLGERLEIPSAGAHLQPVTPCPDIPPMMLPPPKKPRPGFVNTGLYHVCQLLVWQMLSPAYKTVRQELDLPKASYWRTFHSENAHKIKHLYGFSPTLIPPSPHWTDSVKVTGNWLLEEHNWQAPDDLLAFLDAGEKPIYVGFGSMLGEDIEAFTLKVIEAIQLSGKRAILATGWGGLSPDAVNPQEIFVLNSAPHDWLFPRVSLAVHHGGAGTTAAALHAGIPSVVVPFYGDQPFWAWRLQQLGIAPPAPLRHQLTAPALARAIKQASQLPMQITAAALGEQARSENGIQTAIDQLKAWELLPRSSAS